MGPWIDLHEAAQIVKKSPKTLYNLLSQGRISSECAIKNGGIWLFKRKVLEERGLIFVEQKLLRSPFTGELKV